MIREKPQVEELKRVHSADARRLVPFSSGMKKVEKFQIQTGIKEDIHCLITSDNREFVVGAGNRLLVWHYSPDKAENPMVELCRQPAKIVDLALLEERHLVLATGHHAPQTARRVFALYDLREEAKQADALTFKAGYFPGDQPGQLNAFNRVFCRHQGAVYFLADEEHLGRLALVDGRVASSKIRTPGLPRLHQLRSFNGKDLLLLDFGGLLRLKQDQSAVEPVNLDLGEATTCLEASERHVYVALCSLVDERPVCQLVVLDRSYSEKCRCELRDSESVRHVRIIHARDSLDEFVVTSTFGFDSTVCVYRFAPTGKDRLQLLRRERQVNSSVFCGWINCIHLLKSSSSVLAFGPLGFACLIKTKLDA